MKKTVAFLLVFLLCYCAITAGAESSRAASILDFPGKLQTFIYACILYNIPVYGAGYCDILADDRLKFYSYDYEGLAIKYFYEYDNTYTFNLIIGEQYKPWSYILAIQHFCGVSFEEAAKAYCNMHMFKGSKSPWTYEFNGMRLEFTNYVFNIRYIPA